MDPLSQAVLGASLSQASTNDKTKQLSALLIGALAGMAPDLDVLIYSPEDPLLFLEYHRQFTHSLFFIPFGALLCALALYPFAKKKLSFTKVYLFTFLGYATHGLLDACTSYGTQLFWPFSSERVAWNIVSIIDPFFTIPVLILVLLAVFRNKVRYARIAFVYAIIFLSLGLIQKQRAQDAAFNLATQRGHKIERIHVKPSFANRHVWKIIYEDDGRYYVDAVKILWNTTIIPGTSIAKLDIKRDYPWLLSGSKQAKDIERFRWFSSDYLAVNPQDSKTIIDVRYSFIPNNIKMMWGIELNDKNIKNNKTDAHVNFIIYNKVSKSTRKEFMDILF